MKVFAISDLHLSGSCDKPMNIFGGNWENYWADICNDWSQKVTAEDIVLISGDISWAMTLENAVVDLQAIGDLAGEKVIIRGNHDYWWQSLAKVRKALPKGVFAMQNDCLRFGKLLVCGSRLWNLSGTSDDDIKILAREELRLQMSLKAMDNMRKEGDFVVVMCHYPPFDASLRGNNFTNIIEKHNVNVVIYGHLHGKDCRALPQVDINGVKYLLTSCDLVGNKLIELAELQ